MIQEKSMWIARSRAYRFKKATVYYGLCAAVYQVWMARNEAFWEKRLPTVSSSCLKIKAVVKGRIRAVLPKNMRNSDVNWFEAL